MSLYLIDHFFLMKPWVKKHDVNNSTLLSVHLMAGQMSIGPPSANRLAIDGHDKLWDRWRAAVASGPQTQSSTKHEEEFTSCQEMWTLSSGGRKPLMASQGESDIVQLKSTQLATLVWSAEGRRKKCTSLLKFTVAICVLRCIVHTIYVFDEYGLKGPEV